MPSIHDIVNKINESILLPGNAEVFGIGQTVMRKTDKLPLIIKRNGEGTWVGIDDKNNIRLYHKLNSMATRNDKGYGRGAVVTNIYSLSMIVFSNRKKVGQYADELVTLIQSQFPDRVSVEPYQSINILFNNAILNDLQVWGQEYSEEYRLSPEHNLFQINYTVEASFTKGCFNNCPEE